MSTNTLIDQIRLAEKVNLSSDPVLLGHFDRLIESMAFNQAMEAMRATKTGDITEWDLFGIYTLKNLNPDVFMLMCATVGVNVYRAVIATHDVSGRDYFVQRYIQEIKSLVEG